MAIFSYECALVWVAKKAADAKKTLNLSREVAVLFADRTFDQTRTIPTEWMPGMKGRFVATMMEIELQPRVVCIAGVEGRPVECRSFSPVCSKLFSNECCTLYDYLLETRRKVLATARNEETPRDQNPASPFRRPDMAFVHTFVAGVCLAGCPITLSAKPLTVEAVKELFSEAQLMSDPIEVNCTLSGGAETTCIKITVVPTPTTYEAGPWCPTHVDDGPKESGIWFYEGEVVEADGEFFNSLALLYEDDNWQIVDPKTGDIRYMATLEACDAAARPDVAEEHQNNCVQCLIGYSTRT